MLDWVMVSKTAPHPLESDARDILWSPHGINPLQANTLQFIGFLGEDRIILSEPTGVTFHDQYEGKGILSFNSRIENPILAVAYASKAPWQSATPITEKISPCQADYAVPSPPDMIPTLIDETGWGAHFVRHYSGEKYHFYRTSVCPIPLEDQEAVTEVVRHSFLKQKIYFIKPRVPSE